MNRKAARLCIISGIALLAAAIMLVLFNLHQDRRSGETAQELLSAVRMEIPEPAGVQTVPVPAPPSGDLFAEYEADVDVETPLPEPVVEWDGRTYIGILMIPVLNLELPVLAEHTSENLKLAPSRYRGTAADDTLIVAAHNYRSHFGTLASLCSGDIIQFTDAAGTVYEYRVMHSETVDSTDISGMEAGAGEEWHLTLFTCTLGGRSRVTIRAVRC